MMITYREFYTQLIGARLADEQRWMRLNLEAALWGMMTFDDRGVWYVPAREREEGAVLQ